MEPTEFTEKFYVAPSMKRLMVLGLFLIGAGLILSILLPFFAPVLLKLLWIWIPVIIGYCFFLRLFIKAWRERNYYITVNEKGIAKNSPSAQIEFIKWEDIAKIRENNIFERLTITDKNHKEIKVEYELENLTNFINILIKNIHHLTNQYSSNTIFHRKIYFNLFNVVMILFVGSYLVFKFVSGEYIQSLLFVVISAYFVYHSLVEFIRIEIKNSNIDTVFPLWRRTIGLSSVKDIQIEIFRGSNYKAAQCVLVRLNNGKTMRMNTVKEGVIALYAALSRKFKEYQLTNQRT